MKYLTDKVLMVFHDIIVIILLALKKIVPMVTFTCVEYYMNHFANLCDISFKQNCARNGKKKYTKFTSYIRERQMCEIKRKSYVNI